MLDTVTNPQFLQGVAVGGVLGIVLTLALAALIGRLNDDDVDPHAANLGTGATWPGSATHTSAQVHPRSRRSDLRSRPR